MQKPYMIQLPYERGEQMKAILAAKETTVVAYLSDLIRREIAAGTIPDGIPDFEIKASGDGFLLGFSDGLKERMSRENTKKLADTIYEAATADKKFSETQIDRHFVVARAAGSVKVTIPANGITRRFNSDIAEDLARQIDRALDSTD